MNEFDYKIADYMSVSTRLQDPYEDRSWEIVFKEKCDIIESEGWIEVPDSTYKTQYYIHKGYVKHEKCV